MKKSLLILLAFIFFGTSILPVYSRRPPRKDRKGDLMKRYDRNKDGKISLDEWLAMAKDRFNRLDKNGDGFLERGEGRPSRRGRGKR